MKLGKDPGIKYLEKRSPGRTEGTVVAQLQGQILAQGQT